MSIPLIITTAVATSDALDAQARQLSDELEAPYVQRRDMTVAEMFRETGTGRLLIVERERLRLRDKAGDGVEYAFHPNLALVRAHNLLRGARDLFADASGLGAGDRLLDCTLGFAAEATLGAMLVGPEGTVVGLESVPELAVVTRAGVAQFALQNKRVEEALRRISVVTADYGEYLSRCAPGAFDVVYFDPFFGERLSGSEEAVDPLAFFGCTMPLKPDAVRRARRIATRRVVVKRPRWQPLPGGLEQDIASYVVGRRNRIEYDIFLPLSS